MFKKLEDEMNEYCKEEQNLKMIFTFSERRMIVLALKTV